MKRILSMIIILTILLSFISCNKSVEYSEYSFMAMDTIINIRLYAKESDAKPIFKKCETLTREIEKVLSSHDKQSQVYEFNNSESGIVNPALPIRDIVELALNVNAKIGNDFDITAAPLFFMWQDCAETNQLPTEYMIAQNMAHKGYDKILLTENSLEKLDPLCSIDLGGIGKGYALDEVKKLIISEGVEHALINFGGNIAVVGGKPEGTPFKIGIKDPENPNKSVCYINMVDTTVSVSGVYERFVVIDGEKYHHIIDPSTGYPAKSGLLSVAVICADSTLADALSTAFLIMGMEKAQKVYSEQAFDFEAIFIDNNGEITTTKGLNDLISY